MFEDKGIIQKLWEISIMATVGLPFFFFFVNGFVKTAYFKHAKLTARRQ